MQFAIADHGGQAGGYRIAYQPLDDALPVTGTWDAANATQTAHDPDVMVYLVALQLRCGRDFQPDP